MKQYLECGKIVNTHGVRGAVRIESACDSPEVLAGLPRVFFLAGGEYTERKLLSASVHKNIVLATIEGVPDMDAAIALKGTVLYADRGDIDIREGAHFIEDLIGLPVIDMDSGRQYGTLRDVFNRGASDIYSVDTDRGEALVPAVSEFVKKIDTEKGIFIKPIAGMFDEI